MTTKEYVKKYRRNGRLRRVILHCTKCGRKMKIHAADKSIYTAQKRATYTCAFCNM